MSQALVPLTTYRRDLNKAIRALASAPAVVVKSKSRNNRPARRRHRKRAKQQKRGRPNRGGALFSGGNPIFKAYALSLENPFRHTPPPLGYGANSSLIQKLVAYTRTPWNVAATGAFVVVLNPNACCSPNSNSAASIAILAYFLSLLTPATVNSPIISSTATGVCAASPNCASNNNLISVKRVIAAQLRVSMGALGAGSQPGYIGALRMPGIPTSANQSALDSLTISTFANDLLSEYILGSSTEGASGLQRYVPVDANDFTFQANAYGNGADSQYAQPLIVYGWGWPTGCPMLIESFLHMEGLAGALQAFISNPLAPSPETTMVDAYPSTDALMSQVSRIPRLANPQLSATVVPPEPEWMTTTRGWLRGARGMAHEAGQLISEVFPDERKEEPEWTNARIDVSD
jgi:hypothetical protein